MTQDEERALIEACAKAMGYEVSYLDNLGWRRNVIIRGDRSPWKVDWNPLHNSGDCAEMEDALDVDIQHWQDFVIARDALGEGGKRVDYPDNPTLKQKSAARRLAVCRCVAASVEKEK